MEWTATRPSGSASDKALGAIIAELHAHYLPLVEGKISRAIPLPAGISADTFAVCAVTLDGQQHGAGDVDAPLTLQSIAKPFVFGMALEDHGPEFVRRRIGVEPTGSAFDRLIPHDEISRGRFNPMVNAGAIATTSLLKGRDNTERRRRLLDGFEAYVGHPVERDPQGFSLRQQNDHLNRAMAHFLRHEGLLRASVDDTVDLYATQCALRVNAIDLAMMAATLANGGVHPCTGRRALAEPLVKNVLSVMFSSGLYDDSGRWAFEVGLPSKSGLAGAILSVIPGRLGVAVYSPPLGANNKSVRAVRVLTDLSARLSTHVFQPPAEPATPKPRSGRTAAQVRLAPLFQSLIEKYAELQEGRVYASEPDLGETDRGLFAISAVMVDGRECSVGTADEPFLIQSISKAFVYGLALEDRGREHVQRRVDIEPTGDRYDAIIKVEHKSKRSHNPMVNTGGLATTSLIRGKGRAQRLRRILEMYTRYIGHPVHVDAPALLAEQSANDRNRAICYLLRNFGMVDGPIEETLDLYLQQCCTTVTTRDLAMMAATLANGGVNPRTGERAIAADFVKDLLSVMYTCGMYDYAGEWAYRVGLPAKSGVSGGILAVVPGRMGIAVHSPPLDERGNSVRGIKVFEELSQTLHLHIFDTHGN